jgi:ubiquinone/menaquinone biosynthesis C-methylase UbiE
MPVSSAEEVKRRAQIRFGAAAERYLRDHIHVEGDELRRMVELARLTGAERVLDVATGGGHTALAFAPHVGEVVGLDLTPAMLEAATKFVAAQGGANVSFRLGDAEDIPFSHGEFDVSHCALCAPPLPTRTGSWPSAPGSCGLPAGW